MMQFAPQLNIPYAIAFPQEDIPIVPTTYGTMWVIYAYFFIETYLLCIAYLNFVVLQRLLTSYLLFAFDVILHI